MNTKTTDPTSADADAHADDFCPEDVIEPMDEPRVVSDELLHLSVPLPLLALIDGEVMIPLKAGT